MYSFEVYFDSKIEIVDFNFIYLSIYLSISHLFLPLSLSRYFGIVCMAV